MAPRSKRSLLALGSTLAALSAGGCRSVGEPEAKQQQVVTNPAPSPASPAPPSAPRLFGSPLSLQEPTALGELLAFPEPLAGKEILVEGTVRRACSRKGCWMELATSADPKAPACRVTFRDYAFFVPTDSAGQKARVQGSLIVREMERAHVEHLESEGATFADKNPDGTVQEVRIVATGVELWRG